MTAIPRVQAIVGSSVRLRDEAVTELLSTWSGPVKRVAVPEIERILLDLDTPSLFEDPALWLIRPDEKTLKKHRDALLQAVARPAVAGHLLLVLSELDGRDVLAKALAKADALRLAGPPSPKETQGWLVGRLLAQGIADPGVVAAALGEHCGEDVDALLSALELAQLYAGDERVSAATVHAVCGGSAERPMYELSGAILDGDAAKAITLLHAGAGAEPEYALSALLNELRKLVACTETTDDAQAATWAGARGKPNLFYARKRARALGRVTLLRLFQGALNASRDLRRTGHDPAAVIELLVLHARRVVRESAR